MRGLPVLPCSSPRFRGAWCRCCRRGRQPGRGVRIPASPAHTWMRRHERVHPSLSRRLKFPAVPNPNLAPSCLRPRGSLRDDLRLLPPPVSRCWAGAERRWERERQKSCSSQKGSFSIPAANADLAPAVLAALGREQRTGPGWSPSAAAFRCPLPLSPLPSFAAGWASAAPHRAGTPPKETLRWDAGVEAWGDAAAVAPRGDGCGVDRSAGPRGPGGSCGGSDPPRPWRWVSRGFTCRDELLWVWRYLMEGGGHPKGLGGPDPGAVPGWEQWGADGCSLPACCRVYLARPYCVGPPTPCRCHSYSAI